jgi:hypothetical protein
MKTKFILFFAAILFILFYFLYNSKPNFSSKKYNQKEWVEKPRQRVLMANDIIENKIFIGKDSTQILNELGKSHEEIKDNNWKYLLDYKGYLHFDLYFLTIHFNNGRVDKVFIEKVKEN